MQLESEAVSAVPSASASARRAIEDCGLAEEERESLDMRHLITLTS